MQQYLILKTGSALPATRASRGDFDDLFIQGLGINDAQARVVDVAGGDSLPDSGYAAVVITGSAANVTESPDFLEPTARWLKKVVHSGVPTLGVCFGHQLLAHSLGGTVVRNMRGRQLGLVTSQFNQAAADDPLLGTLPRPPRFHLTHQEVVSELPPGAVLLSAWEADAHQAFRFQNAWGVQFHPEFDGEITAHYIDRFEQALQSEGHDLAALRGQSQANGEGRALLRRFNALVQGRVAHRGLG